MTHAEWVDDPIAKGFDVKQGDDIGSDVEMQYMEKVTQPIFVTHFRCESRHFIPKKILLNQAFALCADLLAPEGCGEIIWGATREDNYDKLLAKSMNTSSQSNNSNGISIYANTAVSHMQDLVMVSSVSSDGSADSIISVRLFRSTLCEWIRP